jgi:hypothetical protein
MMFSYEHAFDVKGIVVARTSIDVRTSWPSCSKKLDEFAGAKFRLQLDGAIEKRTLSARTMHTGGSGVAPVMTDEPKEGRYGN